MVSFIVRRGACLAGATLLACLSACLTLSAAEPPAAATAPAAAAPAVAPVTRFPICTRTIVRGTVRDTVRTQWGYMDRQGQVVIAPQYEEAGDFHEGLARIKLNGKYGYVAPDGKVVIPPTFLAAGDFAEGLAPIAVLVPQPAKKSADPELGLDANAVPMVRRWGLIDATGAVVTPPYLLQLGSFSEGLAPAITEVSNSLWGYVDHSGKLVIPQQFTEAHAFREGRAVVHASWGGWGAIAPTGKWLLEPDFDALGDFSGGLAPAYREPKVADNESMATKLFTAGPEVEADTLRQTLIEGNTGEAAAKLERAQDRGRHRARFPGKDEVRYKDGAGRGYVDLKGALVIPAEFLEARVFVDGLALVALEQDTAAAPTITNIPASLAAPAAAPKRAKGQPAVPVVLGYGYISRDGTLRAGGDYAGAQDFSEGLAVVWTGTDWTYIDATGKRVADAEYATARPYHGGLALVTRRLKEGLVEQYIDAAGQPVGPAMPVVAQPAPPQP